MYLRCVQVIDFGAVVEVNIQRQVVIVCLRAPVCL